MNTISLQQEFDLPQTNSLNSINLIGNYEKVMSPKQKKREYQNCYKRMPIKISSTNFLETYVLHILAKYNYPMYALEILNSLSELYNDIIWKPSHGTLYPLLNKMAEKGYITVSVKKTAKVGKKYYSITNLGMQILYDKKKSMKGIVVESEIFFKNIYRELYI